MPTDSEIRKIKNQIFELVKKYYDVKLRNPKNLILEKQKLIMGGEFLMKKN